MDLETLYRQITANYLALANLKRTGLQSEGYKNVEESIMNHLNENLKTYRELSGKNFEMSEELKRIVNI